MRAVKIQSRSSNRVSDDAKATGKRIRISPRNRTQVTYLYCGFRVDPSDTIIVYLFPDSAAASSMQLCASSSIHVGMWVCANQRSTVRHAVPTACFLSYPSSHAKYCIFFRAGDFHISCDVVVFCDPFSCTFHRILRASPIC